LSFRLPAQSSTVIFAGIILGIVGIFIVPLPPVLLDVLFAFDLVFAGMVLVTSIVIREPIEFAAFAPLLLIATLFRLSLDVSATRLILTKADVPNGVGSLIPAFGAFVVQGNLVVGIIIFAILTTIQFVVIASGAGRVAEVAARFTLDALPGKQMAIDAELHAGAIDQATAKLRRRTVQREADFFGAMDGAGKFIKGDAIAALVIVLLNLVGGVVIGVVMHGKAFDEALSTYALDSIGNALLTTLPSFLLSTSMGLLVTRVSADGSLGADVVTQVLGRPMVLRIAGTFACALALIPAMPHLVFMLLGVGLFVLASVTAKRTRVEAAATERERNNRRRTTSRRPEVALSRIGVDAMTLYLGRDVLTLCDGDAGEALLDRIADVRRVLASELGIVLPGIRLRDRLEGDPTVYAIAVRGEVVAGGQLRLDALLAVAEEEKLSLLDGETTRDPVYGLAARYISPELKEFAMQSGALVFDPTTILTSHLAEVARNHAAKFLGRQELQTLLDHLRASVPAVVKDVMSERIGIASVLRVLQGLLQEKIWPRDLVAVLESLVDAHMQGMDERGIMNALRARMVPLQLKRQGITHLTPLLLDPQFEHALREAWQTPQGAAQADPRLLTTLRDAVVRYAQTAIRAQSAMLCSGSIRSDCARFVQRLGVDVPVYAFSEIASDIIIQPLVSVGAPIPEVLVSA
jgi:flagellar biosynthesis protein FlhA